MENRLSKIRLEPTSGTEMIVVRNERRFVSFEQLRQNEIFLW